MPGTSAGSLIAEIVSVWHGSIGKESVGGTVYPQDQ